VFDNGWVTVGDLAMIDEDHYVTIVGRKHNMIVSGGLNVYPEEVEQVLASYPDVEEIAVLGIDDSYWGEKVVAVLSVHSPIKKATLDQYVSVGCLKISHRKNSSVRLSTIS